MSEDPEMNEFPFVIGCPFCGGEEIVGTVNPGKRGGVMTQLVCKSCGGCGPVALGEAPVVFTPGGKPSDRMIAEAMQLAVARWVQRHVHTAAHSLLLTAEAWPEQPFSGNAESEHYEVVLKLKDEFVVEELPPL